MISILEIAAPLLSQEGWREEPGWFQSETLLYCGFGTTPRAIASQSRCPPDSGGQFSLNPPIQFIATLLRPRLQAIRAGEGLVLTGNNFCRIQIVGRQIRKFAGKFF